MYILLFPSVQVRIQDHCGVETCHRNVWSGTHVVRTPSPPRAEGQSGPRAAIFGAIFWAPRLRQACCGCVILHRLSVLDVDSTDATRTLLFLIRYPPTPNCRRTRFITSKQDHPHSPYYGSGTPWAGSSSKRRRHFVFGLPFSDSTYLTTLHALGVGRHLLGADKRQNIPNPEFHDPVYLCLRRFGMAVCRAHISRQATPTPVHTCAGARLVGDVSSSSCSQVILESVYFNDLSGSRAQAVSF